MISFSKYNEHSSLVNVPQLNLTFKGSLISLSVLQTRWMHLLAVLCDGLERSLLFARHCNDLVNNRIENFLLNLNDEKLLLL